MTIELGALSLGIDVPKEEALARIRAVDKAAADAGKNFIVAADGSKKFNMSLLEGNATLGASARLLQRRIDLLGEGVKIDGTRAASLTRLKTIEQELTAKLATGNLTLAERIRTEKALVMAQEASGIAAAGVAGKFSALGMQAGRTGLAVAFGMQMMADGAEGGSRAALRAIATLGLAFGPHGILVSAAATGFSALLDWIHRTEKETTEAWKRLKEKSDDLNAGPGGKTSVDLGLARKQLEAERAKLTSLRAPRALASGSAAARDIGDISAGTAAGKAAALGQEILEQERIVSTVEAHVRDLERKATEQSVRETVLNTAKLASAHQLSANELKNALTLRASLQRQLADLNKTGGAAERRAELVGQIKDLDDALKGGQVGRSLRSADLSMAKQHAESVNRIIGINAKAEEDASEEQYKRGEISLTAHYAKREQLIREATDRELETLKDERARIAATIASGPEETARRAGQLQDVDDRMAEVRARGGQSLAALGRSRAGDQEQLDNRAEAFAQKWIRAKDGIAAAAKAAIDKEMEDQRKLMVQKGTFDEAELERIRTIVTARVNATMTEKELQEQLASYEAARAAIHEKISTGQITELEGARELKQLASDRLPILQSLLAQLQAMAAASNDPDLKKLVESLAKTISAASAQLDDPARQLAQRIVNTIRSTLTSGLQGAFADAFSGNGLTGFLKSAGRTVLAALGQVMVDMGEALIPFGALLTTLRDALTNPLLAGPAAIGIGVTLIALGSALGAAARGGGGGSSSAPSYSSVTPSIIDRGIINPVSYMTGRDASGSVNMNTGVEAASKLTPRTPVNVTIIGTNDPVVQRQMQELIRNADRRGNI